MPGIILLLCAAALLILLLARAAFYKPQANRQIEPEPLTIDTQKAAEHLSQLIQKKTVWSRIPEEIDTDEFRAAIALLRRFYPLVHRELPCEIIDEYGLLFRWKGRSAENPTVLMAHYDVVPAQEAEWHFAPFSGEIADGMIRGRGAIDTKGTLIGILEAAEALLQQGFVPEHDLYFSFANNEETAGETAPDIVSLFRQRGITPAFVLDEGGAVVENIFPGVKIPVALIGISEKGIADVAISAKGAGGHASAPPARVATVQLAKALVRLDGRRFRARLTEPAEKMFAAVGRHMPFGLRILFANLWLFKPVLPKALGALGGELGAMVRTTMAVTLLHSGKGANVLPSDASALANIRILVGESVQGTLERINRILRKTGAKAELVYGIDPSPVSETTGPAYEILRRAVAETYTSAVAPYLMFGGSDSRHFARISTHVYRFTPYELTKGERGRIHGPDEALPAEKLGKCVEFYTRLIKKC